MIKYYDNLLTFLNVKHTKRGVTKFVQEHPFMDTFFGIVAFLEAYGVRADCYRLKDRRLIAKQNELCIVKYNGRFAVLSPKLSHKEMASLYFFNGQQLNVSKDDLINNCDEEIILVEVSKYSCEQNLFANIRDANRTIVKNAIIGLSVLLLIIMQLTSLKNGFVSSNILFFSLIFADLIGVGVTFLLLQRQLHIANKFADKLCGLIKESNCEDVTESSGASIFGMAKLSEIGFGFFSVNLFVLIFMPQYVQSVALYAICVLPFTLWSIWYQKYIVKNWCVMCLCSLCIMWLQAIMFYVGGAYMDYACEWIPLCMVGIIYVLITLLVNRIMTIIEQGRQGEVYKREYNLLKAQDEVISVFKQKASVYPNAFNSSSGLIFGNKDAKYKMTIFSNPYCSHCSDLHDKIQHYPQNIVCINYVFTYFSEDRSLINKYLIAVYQQLGRDAAWEIFSEWYATGYKIGEDFFKKYKLDVESESVIAEFEKQIQWRKRFDQLKGTPTVIVNDIEIDYPFDVEDYRYIG